MLEIIFEPIFKQNDNEYVFNSVKIYLPGIEKAIIVDSKNWISNISDYLPEAFKKSSGEVYLDTNVTKLIMDVKLVAGNQPAETCWMEIVPYYSATPEKIVITIPDASAGVNCEYPFSVSNTPVKPHGNHINDSADRVSFHMKSNENKYQVNINQNADECINATLLKGNEIKNIDTSSGSTEDISFFFVGDVGVHPKSSYINGKFISKNSQENGGFDFYLESSFS